MPSCRRFELFRRFCPLLLVAGMLMTFGAHAADDYAEVQRLAGAGQSEQALALADRYLGAHPRDAQMRFIKANLLGRMGRAEQSELLLVELTREHPELAEPWNNLAVLHAARGRLDEARAALENALRIQPDYATALENLGDVQARLALQSYQRARQLDAANPRLTPKIRGLDALLKSATPAAGG